MSGALDGVRVLDFTQHVNGPLGTMLLADLYARVGTGRGQRVELSMGSGIGAWVLTLRFDTACDDALRAHL